MAVWMLGGLLAAVLAFAAYVRLAPLDPGRWDVSPSVLAWDNGGPWDEVVAMEGGASLRLSTAVGAPDALLARLDAIALATPRTQRLAGSVEAGRITWITRSALWGFPDYTTAEARPDGLYILSRLRFGRSDMGVNAARLKGWQASLTGG
ncbi:MAG: DUF1499 domain-containing protein [Tabrizicola sp.]|uniref:DUF1499 domain-containing protein n=1 Tax=Tabrizicola sp. TaxID=2005166 RepID=UPI002ABA9034|nr:DUF1499 domain-containing protein [Tabrizicola sp.]MDZ4089524.1 DUF1499 domain-containing protein [Tabrizicola sp.]